MRKLSIINIGISSDITKAEIIAKVMNPEMVKSIQELKNQVPLDRQVLQSPIVEDKEGPYKEENAMLDTLSNIQWFIYPFKKTLIHVFNKMLCKKNKDKSQIGRAHV